MKAYIFKFKGQISFCFSSFLFSKIITKNFKNTECSTLEKDVNISMYLSPKSKVNLYAHLTKNLNIKTEKDSIEAVIKYKSSKHDAYVYEPLFGAPLAFRLKGIISMKSGIVVTDYHIIITIDF